MEILILEEVEVVVEEMLDLMEDQAAKESL
jgi:hypothetical protein